MKMIDVQMKFQHGGSTFHPGERRLVEDADAAYFAQHGWATSNGNATGEPAQGDVKLTVQPGGHVNKGRAL